mmetsp:Transcript_474/g.852  ORF Transcript_474/g.852 Transcript_474/m.852 type:complete len:900 (+) Transcript_474:70-2769(+)
MQVPLQAKPAEASLYEAVRAALAPVAHLESRYNETEFGRRVREKIRKQLTDLKDSTSTVVVEQGIAKFVGGSLSRIWQREESHGWVPHVDWESVFVAAIQSWYEGCPTDLSMIRHATKAAVEDWMRLHVHKRSAAVKSLGEASAAPKQPQRPVFTPYGPHGRKRTLERFSRGSSCLTSQGHFPAPVPTSTTVCHHTAAESTPVYSSDTVPSSGSAYEPGAAGRDAQGEEEVAPKAVESTPVLPTWAWLGDAEPPATETLQSDTVVTQTLQTTPPPLQPPPPAAPTPLQLRRPPRPTAEPLPCAGAECGESMSSSTTGSACDRSDKEAYPRTSPGTLADKCRWDEAVQIKERGTIEVSLKGWGLDASAIQGWCSWASSSLPRLASSRQRGGRVVTLHLDFSENKICDEGMKTLADFFIHGLQGIHLRCLRLHRNFLTTNAAAPIAQMIGALGSGPRSAIEELHLSHNALGQDGVMTILESIAGAKVSGDAPTYPISITSSVGAEKTTWKPLWLRIENNGQSQATHNEFVKQVNIPLAEIRRQHGWLSDEALGMMLCPCFAPGSKCTIGHCTRQNGQQWPIAHIACWESSLESVPSAARPKRASSRPRQCASAGAPWPPYKERPNEVQARATSKRRIEQSVAGKELGAESRPAQSEDWRCPHCEETVSSRRSRCFACGEPRPAARSASVCCPRRPSSSAASSTATDVGQAGLAAVPSYEDEWKKLRSDVDSTVAEIVSTILSPAASSRGKRPSYVVLSSQSLGKAYQRSVLHQEHGLSWEGVRAAHEYYHTQNVKVLTVVNENRAHVVPSDLASKVVLTPQFGHGHPLDQLDLFMLRLSMEFDCQYVDNRQRYFADMLHSDLQEWLTGRGEQLKVEFVFDVNGRFIPLKPPSVCVRSESYF